MDNALEASVFVCSSSRLNDVRSRRLADAQVEEWRDDNGIRCISSVDECSCRGIRQLCEAEGGLLRSDEGAGSIEVEISIEVRQRERERVIRRVGCYGTNFEISEYIQQSPGTNSYHCRRPHLERRETF